MISRRSAFLTDKAHTVGQVKWSAVLLYRKQSCDSWSRRKRAAGLQESERDPPARVVHGHLQVPPKGF